MKMNFKDAIITLMAEKGVRSKRELAALTGLHVNTITNAMESKGIPLRSLPAIAKALDVPPSEILRRAEVSNE